MTTDKKSKGKGILLPLALAAGLSMFSGNADATESYKKSLISNRYQIKKVLGTPIDETKYPRIEGDNLQYIVEGAVCGNEEDAKDNIDYKVNEKIANVSGDDTISNPGKKVSNEIYKVKKDGKAGYAYNTIFSVPLTSFNENTREALKSKYGLKKIITIGKKENLEKETSGKKDSQKVDKSTPAPLAVVEGTDASKAEEKKLEGIVKSTDVPKGVYFGADIGLFSYTSQDNETGSDTRLTGNGYNPKIDAFVKFNLPKGSIYLIFENDMQTYNGDMTYHKNKIATFGVRNNEFLTVLGCESKKGFYGGAGWHTESKDALVSIDGFNIKTDHSERFNGIVYNLGLLKKKNKNELRVDFKYKDKIGDVEDKINNAVVNTEHIPEGSEIKGEIGYGDDFLGIKLGAGEKKYYFKGNNKTDYFKLDFFIKLSKKIRGVLGFGRSRTEKEGTKYSNDQIITNFGIDCYLGK